jgi:hypothetical protein
LFGVFKYKKTTVPKYGQGYGGNMFKRILFNILGFVAGAFALSLSSVIASWLLVDIIGSLGFIRNILSWPVDYGTYAFTGILFAEVAAGLSVCSAITQLGKPKYNISCIALSLYYLIIRVLSVIALWKEYGFSFDVLCMLGTVLFFYIFAAFIFCKNGD